MIEPSPASDGLAHGLKRIYPSASAALINLLAGAPSAAAILLIVTTVGFLTPRSIPLT